jgi:hypothetical protein
LNTASHVYSTWLIFTSISLSAVLHTLDNCCTEYRGSLLTGEALAAREREYAKLAGTSRDPGCYMFYFLHDGTLHCVDGTHDRGHDGTRLSALHIVFQDA